MQLMSTVGLQIGDGRRIAGTVEVTMHFTIEHEKEEDGRWLAEVPELPGVLAYGATAEDAMAKAQILALRVLAERLEHNETGPQAISIAVA
jgi:predicted RNase H-like HicB family nuclease